MLQRMLVGSVFLAAGFGAAAVVQTQASKPESSRAAKGAIAADVFGLDKVWQFHLDVPAKDYEAMQPSGGRGGRNKTDRPAVKPADPNADVHRGSGFGVEFPIVHAAFTAGGKTFANVGLRYKGNASYMASSGSVKRSMKIELDHFDENGPKFQGLKKLNLNSGVMDPTKGREALAFAAFRAAGVPAPRTAYAEVSLTVPGKYDNEDLGLYTVIEQVDKTFLKDRFGNGKGLLMKPERMRGIEYLGENWDDYKARYQPKHDPLPAEARRIIDFAKLVNQGSDEQFASQIGFYLDIDEFLRFLGATAMLSNLDSFLTMGHNFYLYLNPMTNRIVFIPWDLDLSLAGFPMGGPADQQLDLSLRHPFSGENKLIERLLAVKTINEKYQQILKELAAGPFSKQRLLADIDTIEMATKDLKAKDANAAKKRHDAGGFGPPGGLIGGRTPDLKSFVEQRTASITAQLAGESQGYTPTNSRKNRGGRSGPGFGGPPGGPNGFPGGPPGQFGAPPMLMMRPPQPGEVLPSMLQEALSLTDAQKQLLAAVQKDVNAKLDKILSTEQKDLLKRMRERGPGINFPGPNGPGEPPPNP